MRAASARVHRKQPRGNRVRGRIGKLDVNGFGNRAGSLDGFITQGDQGRGAVDSEIRHACKIFRRFGRMVGATIGGPDDLAQGIRVAYLVRRGVVVHDGVAKAGIQMPAIHHPGTDVAVSALQPGVLKFCQLIFVGACGE